LAAFLSIRFGARVPGVAADTTTTGADAAPQMSRVARRRKRLKIAHDDAEHRQKSLNRVGASSV
jgi:hypothetical protein